MATTILLDEHLDGYLGYLESLTFNEPCREIAEAIELRFVRLRDVGIAKGVSDRDIWRFCQSNNIYLLTNNREETTEDALGSVIMAEGRPDSLPVFTISDMKRFRSERSYGEALAEGLLDCLFEPDIYLGAGRLYLPG